MRRWRRHTWLCCNKSIFGALDTQTRPQSSFSGVPDLSIFCVRVIMKKITCKMTLHLPVLCVIFSTVERLYQQQFKCQNLIDKSFDKKNNNFFTHILCYFPQQISRSTTEYMFYKLPILRLLYRLKKSVLSENLPNR
jgi:hypothetical protein